MTVHEISRIQRQRGGMVQSNPAENERHRAAGRIPVFHGLRLVAYVDRPEDMPTAHYTDRFGHLVGEVEHWDYAPLSSAELRGAGPA